MKQNIERCLGVATNCPTSIGVIPRQGFRIIHSLRLESLREEEDERQALKDPDGLAQLARFNRRLERRDAIVWGRYFR